MVRHSPVTGRYVTIDVDDKEYKVFYLHNGSGQPLICQHTAGAHNHLRKLQRNGARIFYGHDPEFWQQVPQAPRAVI